MLLLADSNLCSTALTNACTSNLFGMSLARPSSLERDGRLRFPARTARSSWNCDDDRAVMNHTNAKEFELAYMGLRQNAKSNPA
jgi:hypothetical protein